MSACPLGHHDLFYPGSRAVGKKRGPTMGQEIADDGSAILLGHENKRLRRLDHRTERCVKGFPLWLEGRGEILDQTLNVVRIV